MSTSVQLGSITQDQRTVVKNFTASTTRQCNFYGEFDLYSPVVKIEYDEDVFTYNYAYLPNLHRYYFITSIKGNPGETLYLQLREDVLMTFRTQILGLTCEVVRSSTSQAKFLNDNQMPIKADLQVQNYEFSSTPFSTADVVSGNYLLTVIGGVVQGAGAGGLDDGAGT